MLPGGNAPHFGRSALSDQVPKADMSIGEGHVQSGIYCGPAALGFATDEDGHGWSGKLKMVEMGPKPAHPPETL
jgi:hypothetical protein